MRIVRWLLLGLVLATATGAVCEEPRTGPRPLRQDETRTLPKTADREAATGPPIRMGDATARLEITTPTEYVQPIAGAGKWLLLERFPRIGPYETGEPELLLWNPETGERRTISTWQFEKDYDEDIAGFDGEWLLVTRRLSDDPQPAELVIHNVKSGEQRQIATFDPEALIDRWGSAESSPTLIGGKVLLAETVRLGPGDERDQIRVYVIDDERWETLVDLVHAPGESTLLFSAILGGDRIVWWPTGDHSRPLGIVVLDWKAGRRIRFEAPPDFNIVLHGLSGDGRFLIWSGGPPDTPTGPNTSRLSPRRFFGTDLQTMETVDLGDATGPAGLHLMTTNARFAAVPRPFGRIEGVWGSMFDLRGRETRLIVGEPLRGGDNVAILGDWLIVGERGILQPGDHQHLPDLTTLSFFKLPR